LASVSAPTARLAHLVEAIPEADGGNGFAVPGRPRIVQRALSAGPADCHRLVAMFEIICLLEQMARSERLNGVGELLGFVVLTFPFGFFVTPSRGESVQLGLQRRDAGVRFQHGVG
jgi:hypothetical protein